MVNSTRGIVGNDNLDGCGNLVTMGRIVNAFGILGFVKIKTDTAAICNSLAKYKELYLLINGKWVLYKVEKTSPSDNFLWVKFAGVTDRDQALELKGVAVAVPRDTFQKLDSDDEFYWVDLIGLSVYNPKQELLGTVESLMESGSNSVLVVKSTEKEHLIPFVGVYVLDVDLKKRQIIVDWEIDY